VANDQAKTAGTPTPDDTDALEQPGTGGTPVEDDRNAEPGEGVSPDRWKEALQWKAKAERVDELERKVEELEGGSQQPPVAESPEVQAKSDQIDKTLDQAEEFKRRGDPVAALVLEERAERLRLERDLILTRQLDRVPADEHDAVLKHFNRNRHRLGDINAARSELREKVLERDLKVANERLAKLEKGPDPEVMNAPPTHGREINARDTKTRNLTRDAWNRDMAQLDERINDGDRDALQEKYRKQADLRKGQIQVKG